MLFICPSRWPSLFVEYVSLHGGAVTCSIRARERGYRDEEGVEEAVDEDGNEEITGPFKNVSEERSGSSECQEGR